LALAFIVIMVIRYRRRPIPPKTKYADEKDLADDDAKVDEDELPAGSPWFIPTAKAPPLSSDTKLVLPEALGETITVDRLPALNLKNNIIVPPISDTKSGLPMVAAPSDAELLAELDYILNPPVPSRNTSIWTYHPEFWLSDTELVKLRKTQDRDRKRSESKKPKRSVSFAAEAQQVLISDPEKTPPTRTSAPSVITPRDIGAALPELQDHRPFLVDQESLFSPSRATSLVHDEETAMEHKSLASSVDFRHSSVSEMPDSLFDLPSHHVEPAMMFSPASHGTPSLDTVPLAPDHLTATFSPSTTAIAPAPTTRSSPAASGNSTHTTTAISSPPPKSSVPPKAPTSPAKALPDKPVTRTPSANNSASVSKPSLSKSPSVVAPSPLNKVVPLKHTPLPSKLPSVKGVPSPTPPKTTFTPASLTLPQDQVAASVLAEAIFTFDDEEEPGYLEVEEMSALRNLGKP